MVRVVDCLGSNPDGHKRFSPWNYFTCGSDNLVGPELASGIGSGLYLVVVDARLSGNKRGKSVMTMPFLTNSLPVGLTL